MLINIYNWQIMRLKKQQIEIIREKFKYQKYSFNSHITKWDSSPISPLKIVF